MDNYKINIFWSDKDKSFIAICPEFEGLAVVGKTRAIAFKEAEAAIKNYIEIYIEDGVPLPKPEEAIEHSGQVRLRLPKMLHQQSARRAELEGVSLNTYFVDAIAYRNGAEEVLERLMQRLERANRPVIVQHYHLTQEAGGTRSEVFPFSFHGKRFQESGTSIVPTLDFYGDKRWPK